MKLTEHELSQLYQQRTARQANSACPAAEELTRAAMGAQLPYGTKSGWGE